MSIRLNMTRPPSHLVRDDRANFRINSMIKHELQRHGISVTDVLNQALDQILLLNEHNEPVMRPNLGYDDFHPVDAIEHEPINKTHQEDDYEDL